jgi:hypothetical protein
VYERTAARLGSRGGGKYKCKETVVDRRSTGIAVLDGESTRVIEAATMSQEQSTLKRLTQWVYLRLKWSREVRGPAHWLTLRPVVHMSTGISTAQPVTLRTRPLTKSTCGLTWLDGVAVQIDPYVKVVLLHSSRYSHILRTRSIIVRPPTPHAESSSCMYASREVLGRRYLG